MQTFILPDTKDGTQLLSLSIDRSSATVFFAVFVMTVMWLLTLGVLGLVIQTVAFGHELQLGYLGFMSALLFAFPGIRSALPGAPPLGSLTDFVSFFWCETLVALGLSVLIVVWLIRQHRNPAGIPVDSDD